jgi:hypothetical protein
MAGILGGVAFLAGASALVVACSSAATSGFDTANGGDGGPGSGGGPGGGPGFGTGSGGDGGSGVCQGIGCQVAVCNNGTPTTLVGQVFDPAGKNPLYNVIVYVPTDPNAALPALTQGSSCDLCGATALNPVVSTLTDENGMFTLKGVPTMAGVPVVVQVGKWRKKITFDVTASCAENKITQKITLPKNGSEGDMPQIAVTTGGCDSLECLLTGIGIDTKEFVQGDAAGGHVHLYKGGGGSTGVDAQSKLWGDVTTLSKYDLVALSCECSENNTNKPNMQPMHDYINAGGRVFATHYHYTWFKNNPNADFKGVANWASGTDPLNDVYNVNQTFPKGTAFAKWLVNVGASSAPGGTIKLNGGDVSDDLSSVTAGTSQSWIEGNTKDVKYFTFNAPIGAAPAAQCGRAVYSDLHVSSNGGENFPSACIPAPGADLSAQQKALEFMLFDLSSCVQADSTPPTPPK